MPTDWKTPLAAALRETDPAKIPNACERARLAIHGRLFELVRERPADLGEREQLDEAMRRLFLHENRPL